MEDQKALIEAMQKNHLQQTRIYMRLREIGKSLNERLQIPDLYNMACDFVVNELDFEKCLIFQHDDTNGWFKIVKSVGYDNPVEQKILGVVNLLLSGEIIEYLRVHGKPITHSVANPNEKVEKLTKSLFLSEAYFELFGGDVEIPFGLIVVGNGLHNFEKFSRIDTDEMVRIALGNFTAQFSNTINNIIFYNAWRDEKQRLEENIIKRTREITEQKETFEAIYKTSKDGIALLDVETTAFLDVNDAYAQMTGYSKEALLRTSCLKLSAKEDQARSLEAVQEVIQKGFITNFEKSCIKKSGEVITTNMSIALMGDKKRMLASVKDVTPQKILEQNLIKEKNIAEARKEELAEVNKQVQDSIEYASLIQRALMPETEQLDLYFSDHFAFWEPKDIVGGDIYLFEPLRHEDETLMMVIDCTGHGVAGAFVTMLVKAIERQIVAKLHNMPNEEISPARILSYFNRAMKKLLKQEDDESISNAGFDGAILYCDRRRGIVRYAGACVPLFYTQNGSLHRIAPDRHSIGYKKSDGGFIFTDHTVTLAPEMNFYVTTDGFLDQLGGTYGLPMGKKRFEALLERVQGLSFQAQKLELEALLHSYQGDQERNDDITVIAIRY